MKRFWQPILATLMLIAPMTAQAQSGDSSSDGPTSAGKWDLRGGVSLDLDKTINLGGSNEDTRAAIGANVGIGYFLIDNLALDLETRAVLQISPETDLERLQLTPGLRFHPTPHVYARAGIPVVLAPEFGYGALAGVGYRQPLGKRAAFVLSVDYTYWLTEYYQTLAPNGQLEVSAGVQTSF